MDAQPSPPRSPRTSPTLSRASTEPASGPAAAAPPPATPIEATIYEPVVCLILQGRKDVTHGSRTVSFGPGEALLVSHDLPVESRVTEASPEAPYLAVVLTLDLALLRRLDLPGSDLDPAPAQSVEVHAADQGLIDAFARYLALSPQEADLVGPVILQELYVRLLMAPHGGMLRRLLRPDSHASGIAQAVRQIRADISARLVVPELARGVGMSPSLFYRTFKAITATTPLQYQKDLRLLEARRLLVAEGYGVSDAAFAVGYESPTQFSREFARKFGGSPRSQVRPRGGRLSAGRRG
ncbi:MAG: AraC family transcriptional regulator [bacterium]